MITILIAGNDITDNERIAGSIIGGTELTTCIISTRSAAEALELARKKEHRIDLFIISIKMKEQSGYRLAEKIRKISEYSDCPILFVTSLSYNLSGFSNLATYQSYRKFNYIALPITRIDVQGKLGLYLEDILSNQSLRNKTERAIFLSHTKGETFVGVNDILFAEIRNKICTIFTVDATFEVSRRNLSNIIDTIDDDYFLRCHRSFALNVRHLRGIKKVDRRIWKAVFDRDSEPCLISKSYIESVRDSYKTFQVK